MGTWQHNALWIKINSNIRAKQHFMIEYIVATQCPLMLAVKLSYTDTALRYDDDMATWWYDIFQKQGYIDTSSIYKLQ
jgi:hypothetical protein